MTKASGGNEAVKVCNTTFKFHVNCRLWHLVIFGQIMFSISHICILQNVMDFNVLPTNYSILCRQQLIHHVSSGDCSMSTDEQAGARNEMQGELDDGWLIVRSTCGYICLSCIITTLKF